MLKILIVEDDKTSELLLEVIVEKYSKNILKTSDSDEDIVICKNNPDIDLIFMDIRLPQMSGYEITQQIRKFNKNVIIIAQTAYALSGEREKAIEAGCNDYISKPYSIELIDLLIEKYFKLEIFL